MFMGSTACPAIKFSKTDISLKKKNLKSLELGIKLEEETKKAKKHRRSFL